MASLHRKSHNRSTFSTSAPHFLKIISKGTCNKLRIPKNFLLKYGDNLSNPVFLKLSSGSEWKIELRKWDDEVWFDKGWPEFSKFYSLHNCHSLVFRYKWNSKFCVCIIDKNFTEIDYPLTVPVMKETDENDESSDDSDDESSDESSDDSDDDDSSDDSGDHSMEIREKILPCRRKTREKSLLPCPRLHKKSRTSSSGEAEFPAKRHGGCTSSTPRLLKQTRSAKAALQSAKAFKSDNPSFIVSMTQTYINQNFVWLPSEFSILMERLNKKSGDVMLRVSSRRTWSLELIYRKPKVRFQLIGWSNFVRANNLKVGDVCVFVLIDEIGLTFEVIIFRAISEVDGEQTMPFMEEINEEDESVEILENFPPCPKTRKRSSIVQPHKKNRNKIKDVGGSDRTQKFLKRRSEVPRMTNPVMEGGTDRALQRAKAFQSEYPSCTITLHPSYILASYLYLGAKFTKENLLNRTRDSVILRVSDGGTWPVKLGQQAKDIVRLQNGWMTFVNDNHLKIGEAIDVRGTVQIEKSRKKKKPDE